MKNKQAMNILLIDPWDQEYGGVGQVTTNLAKYLQSRGHLLTFFHPGGTKVLKRRMTKSGFPGFQLSLRGFLYKSRLVHSILAFFAILPSTMYQLMRTIVKCKIQIINIHYPLDCFLYFAICRWMLPIRLVTSLHGADMLPVGKPRQRYSLMLKFLLYSSDLIVAPSKGFLNDVSRVFPRLRRKMIFIHNGVNIDELKGGGNSLGRERARYLLCIAAHKEAKGVDVLIRAFALVRNRDPRLLMLVLVGDGPRRGDLEDLAKRLGVDEHTQFVGWQGREEIAELLHGCEAVVLPSRSESFGIVLIEAMACKKPVVASAVGGIPEIIENGKSGILVKADDPLLLADALMAVVGDKELQERLGNYGYNVVRERFRREHSGASYERVFAALVSRREEVASVRMNE